jgi:hypothetical protein
VSWGLYQRNHTPPQMVALNASRSAHPMVRFGNSPRLKWRPHGYTNLTPVNIKDARVSPEGLTGMNCHKADSAQVLYTADTRALHLNSENDSGRGSRGVSISSRRSPARRMNASRTSALLQPPIRHVPIVQSPPPLPRIGRWRPYATLTSSVRPRDPSAASA